MLQVINVGCWETCSEARPDVFLHLRIPLCVCADDRPGGASVWSPAAGALWRIGG